MVRARTAIAATLLAIAATSGIVAAIHVTRTRRSDQRQAVLLKELQSRDPATRAWALRNLVRPTRFEFDVTVYLGLYFLKEDPDWGVRAVASYQLGNCVLAATEGPADDRLLSRVLAAMVHAMAHDPALDARWENEASLACFLLGFRGDERSREHAVRVVLEAVVREASQISQASRRQELDVRISRIADAAVVEVGSVREAQQWLEKHPEDSGRKTAR